MPKKAVSPQEKQNLELLAALRAGQVRAGDCDFDTARFMPIGKSTFSRRKQAPENFTIRELRVLAQRYRFTDYQLCQIIGVEYHGSTPA